MSRVHLVGGGRDEALLAPLFAAFVADAREAVGDAAREAAFDAAVDAEARPRICVLLVLEPDDAESTERYRSLFAVAGAPDVDVRSMREGEQFAPDALDDVDALAVGGGLTPAYADALAPIAALLRSRVRAGMPYLGFSAGASIAAAAAVVGGWRLHGVPIGDEDAGEELDEVTVRPGLGLVPFSVDVHAAQWGTVTRLAAAVTAGLAGGGYAIDEHTAVVVADDAAPVVTGAGAVWRLRARSSDVVIERLTAT